MTLYKRFILAILFFNYFGLNAEDCIPIIFIHTGKANYLSDTLAQAKEFNDRVILIGDPDNQDCAKNGIEYYPISSFFKQASEFKKIYRHMTCCPYEFELACYVRWFVLKEFMEKTNIPLSFYLDSDVMLYCDITEEYKTNFNNCDLAVAAQQGYYGGLVSYWTPHTIASFCSYLNNFYQNTERINELELQFKSGGQQFNDDYPHMANWANGNHQNFKIGNLCAIKNNTTFDSDIHHHLIPTFNGANIEYILYRMKSYLEKKNEMRSIKDIIWNEGLPYCYSPSQSTFIRFKGLHFQGESKKLINEYRTSRYDVSAEFEPYKSPHLLPYYSRGFFELEIQIALENFIKNHHKLKVIVQLGCQLGKATSFMALLMPKDAKLYSVDCFDAQLLPYSSSIDITLYQPFTTSYQQFLSNMKHNRLCNKVIPLKMSGLDAAQVLNIKPDLVYVDSAIVEDELCKIILIWYEKLNEGGIICGNNWELFSSVQRGVLHAAQKLGKTAFANGNFWYLE